ncbi:MAG: hypothetical protein MZV70_43355 [Desulfobacterales bacterium]|nr:hypothetical protein [Desulfobacterales bacterium]
MATGGFNTPAILTSSILDVNPLFRQQQVGLRPLEHDGSERHGYKHQTENSYNYAQHGKLERLDHIPGSLAQLVAQQGLPHPVPGPAAHLQPPRYAPEGHFGGVDPYIGEGYFGVGDNRQIWLPQGNPASGVHRPLERSCGRQRLGHAFRHTASKSGQHPAQNGELAAGTYSAVVGSLPAGVYFVVMSGPEGMALRG